MAGVGDFRVEQVGEAWSETTDGSRRGCRSRVAEQAEVDKEELRRALQRDGRTGGCRSKTSLLCCLAWRWSLASPRTVLERSRDVGRRMDHEGERKSGGGWEEDWS
jgi:hypothetical protein